MKPISQINLYRIVHIDNLEYILSKGMYARSHSDFDVNNIFIGDALLTEQREVFSIPIKNAGNLGDYVPFYFGYPSPMLYNIQKGYMGVNKRNPNEIVYLVVSLEHLYNQGKKIIFTDGHAKSVETKFFDNSDDLDKIYWQEVNATIWNNTKEDSSRKRKKQAECLIQSEVLSDCIKAIVIYDAQSKQYADNLIQKYGLTIQSFINPTNKFYY